MSNLQNVIKGLRNSILKGHTYFVVANHYADEAINLLQNIGEVNYVKSSFGTHLNFKLHLKDEVEKIINYRNFNLWERETAVFTVPDYTVKKRLVG